MKIIYNKILHNVKYPCLNNYWESHLLRKKFLRKILK